jgi:LysM repeat protein
MPIYTVKPGDTLTSIAKAHGVSSWQALYNDPANAAFKSKRANPNLIYPGDQIVVPGAAKPTPFRLAIIDGTGDSDDTAYAASMANSFCRQLADQLGTTNAHYERGPSWHGKEVSKSAGEAKKWLKQA